MLLRRGGRVVAADRFRGRQGRPREAGPREPVPNTKQGLRVEMTLEQACPPEYWRAQCAFKDSMIH